MRILKSTSAFFLLVHHDFFKAPVVHPNLDVNQTFAPVFPPATNSTIITTLSVNVQTPKYKDDAFPYRNRVTAQISLTGTALLQFYQIVLGPLRPNESQLALWCYAQCGACISLKKPQCNPTDWFLDPSSDPKYNQGFILNPSSWTLTGNVAFDIPLRPKRPKGQDQTRRCNSESLM